MSLLTEVLDRLSGVAVLRERINDLSRRLDRMADLLLDHEKRLTRLESTALPPPARGDSRKK